MYVLVFLHLHFIIEMSIHLSGHFKTYKSWLVNRFKVGQIQKLGLCVGLIFLFFSF